MTRIFRGRNSATDSGQIREFVYLDETSVESLLASVDGEILVQRTNTRSQSTVSGVSAQIGGGTPFGKASFAPTLKKSRGLEVQELRKSVAQSAFARFRAKNLQRFAIRPIESTKASARALEKIASLDPKSLRRFSQGIPLKDLHRGDLIEIETDLVAADIYKARTAISAVTDVVEAYPSFLTIELRDQLKLARPLTSLIDSLNGNAIPVIGENPSVRVAEIDGQSWLVNTGRSESPGVVSNLALEGQTLQPWFWGEVGRILFRPARYRMLCRVMNSSLTQAPSSSYVGSILREIDDGLAETVDRMGSMFLGALRTGHQMARKQRSITTSTTGAIEAYVGKLATLTDDATLTLETVLASTLSAVDLKGLNVSAQTEIFNLIDTALGIDAQMIGEESLGTARDEIRDEFELWPWSDMSADPETDEPAKSPLSFLEVAIVAVYW